MWQNVATHRWHETAVNSWTADVLSAYVQYIDFEAGSRLFHSVAMS
jgi:hypothetical protein